SISRLVLVDLPGRPAGRQALVGMGWKKIAVVPVLSQPRSSPPSCQISPAIVIRRGPRCKDEGSVRDRGDPRNGGGVVGCGGSGVVTGNLCYIFCPHTAGVGGPEDVHDDYMLIGVTEGNAWICTPCAIE